MNVQTYVDPAIIPKARLPFRNRTHRLSHLVADRHPQRAARHKNPNRCLPLAPHEAPSEDAYVTERTFFMPPLARTRWLAITPQLRQNFGDDA
jgi:hypothetical protein